MRFPNAEKGIGKIFLAEILGLIAILPSTIASFLFAAFEGEATVETLSQKASGIIIIVCVAISFVLVIASAVINLMGYFVASKDEDSFRKALFFMIGSAGLLLLGNILQSTTVPAILTNTINSMAQIFQLFVTLFTIFGLISLSVQYNDLKMIQKGTALYKLLFLIYVPSIVAYFFIRVFHDSQAAAILAITMVIIDLVLSVVYYILYLSYLAKAKNMLSR